MKKIILIFLMLVAVNAIHVAVYAQQQMKPTKIPLAPPKVVNFKEQAKYELAHPPVNEKRVILQAEDRNPRLRFKPLPVPPNAIKLKMPLSNSGGRHPQFYISSPSPVLSFNGEMDDGVPPPDINGAAGNTYLMETTNGKFDIFTKTGTLVSSVSPTTFFSSYGPSGLYDPHIVYDFANNRYIIIIVGSSNTTREVGAFVAVSQTSDPTGSWFTYFYNVDPAAGGFFMDYPLLGYNTNWVVATLSAGKVYVFNRASLYSGTLGTVNSFSAISSGTVFLGPAQTYDNTQTTEYLVENYNGNSGGDGYVQINTITGTPDAPVYTNGSTIGIPNTWSDDLIEAPQSGGTQPIEGGDSRINNCVYVNNSLWFCHSVMLPASAPTHSAIDWWQLDPSTPILMQFGRVEDATESNFYFYPSMNVNSNGDALLGYCQSSSSIFSGAAYSIHAASDPTDTLETSKLYKQGLGFYNNLLNGRNRWGDFTGTAVDPTDGSFWNFSEWANTGNKWGTVIANVKVPPAPELYSQDVSTDNGTEPDPSTSNMWTSPDIWLRTSADPTFTFAHMGQDAQHPGTNYVYVEVRNRGTAASLGTEQLTLYWAKGGSFLSWPTSWDGSSYFDPPTNSIVMGQPIATHTIPSIPAGGNTILTFTWTAPDPATYSSMFPDDANHFCLLSRITTSTTAPFGMTFPETTDLNGNTQKNNKIAWRNLEVYPAPNSPAGPRIPFHPVIGNLGNTKMKVKFKFSVLDENGVAGFLDKGKLEVVAQGGLKDILKQNKVTGDGIKETGEGTFEISKDGAALENIYLEPKAIGAFAVTFIPNDTNQTGKGYAINFTQIEDLNGTDHIIGGQTAVYGQVKGFGTSQPGAGTASICWHWWYWIIIVILILLLLYFLMKKK